jgi:hypothetical protein
MENFLFLALRATFKPCNPTQSSKLPFTIIFRSHQYGLMQPPLLHLDPLMSPTDRSLHAVSNFYEGRMRTVRLAEEKNDKPCNEASMILSHMCAAPIFFFN